MKLVADMLPVSALFLEVGYSVKAAFRAFVVDGCYWVCYTKLSRSIETLTFNRWALSSFAFVESRQWELMRQVPATLSRPQAQ